MEEHRIKQLADAIGAVRQGMTDTRHRAVEQAERQVFELVRILLPDRTERASVDLDFDPVLWKAGSASWVI